jgi:uncharacterized protein (DUF1684 family)
MKNIFVALTGLFLLSAFRAETSYETSIKQWQQQRIESLKAEDGWLNLAGLYWLEEGKNTLGSNDKNTILFPADHSDAFVGTVTLNKGTVHFTVAPPSVVKTASTTVTHVQVFPYKDNPVVLAHQSLRWFVIQRGAKYAIRLRDLENPILKEFKGIETFPIDEKWKIKAQFVPTVGRKIKILDVTGRIFEEESPGKLIFKINGGTYSLETTGTKAQLFIVFGDATNNLDTYGGGRFLEVDAPLEDGSIYLDFNKAYNPPCAFTPYATCPLPTKENKLKVAISAGEQFHGSH